jgi:hypothetical protein
MARGVVVDGRFGAGLGIAARPHAGIHSVPGRLARQRIGGHQRLARPQIHGVRGEGIIPAGPAALAAGDHTQLGQRLQARCGQDRVQELKAGVTAAPKQRVPLMAERLELFSLGSVQNRKDELTSLFLSTPNSMTLCCWLKRNLS